MRNELGFKVTNKLLEIIEIISNKAVELKPLPIQQIY